MSSEASSAEYAEGTCSRWQGRPSRALLSTDPLASNYSRHGSTDVAARPVTTCCEKPAISMWKLPSMRSTIHSLVRSTIRERAPSNRST